MNRDNLPAAMCPCSIGFYDNGVQLCVACHPSCRTCSGPLATDCTSCLDSATSFRINNVAIGGNCPCQANYYHNAVPICAACHPSCLTCSLGNLSTQCDSCDTTWNRNTVGSTCPCNTYFYDDGTHVCKACHHSCQTCNGITANDCLSCNALWNRNTSGTTCPCNALFFDNGVQVCASCNYACATCSNLTSCSTCPIGSNRINPASLCPCNTGYYDDGTSNPICGTCDKSCLTCAGGNTVNDCTKCPDETISFRVNQAPISGQCPC